MLEIFENKKFDNNIAIIDNGKEYSYQDLKNLITARIIDLKNAQNNVVILDLNHFDFIINFFAAIFSQKNIYLISDTKKLNHLPFEYDILTNFEHKSDKEYCFPKINLNDVSLNFHTSGSTGNPKTIKKSLMNFVNEVQDIISDVNLQNLQGTIISTTTMCHTYGLTFNLVLPFVLKQCICTDIVSYPENLDNSKYILVSTPTFLNSILKCNTDFKTAPEYIFSAGSKLDENLFKKLEEKSKVTEIYGSTETCSIAYKTHYSDNFNLLNSVKIKVNQNNIEVKTNYMTDNSVIINDCAELKGKSLIIKNRTDRLFKIYDKRVSAEELENILRKHDFVDNCYMLKKDEKLACFCALNKTGTSFAVEYGIAKLTKELKNFMSGKFEIIPQKWKFIDNLPMTQTGKIDQNTIEHIFNINLSLPLILERKIKENNVEYKIFFYKNCNFFKGHFPNFNIVAGVVQLYFAKLFANYQFKTNINEGQMKRIKFSNIIKSDSIVNLTLKKNEKSVEFEYYNDDMKYSSGVFSLSNIFEGEQIAKV